MRHRSRCRGRRARSGRSRVALSIVVASLLLAAPASAERNAFLETGEAVFDVVVLRPTGLVALVVGVAAFVPVAVLTSPGGSDALREGLDHFVLTPWSYTFERPVGSF